MENPCTPPVPRLEHYTSCAPWHGPPLGFDCTLVLGFLRRTLTVLPLPLEVFLPLQASQSRVPAQRGCQLPVRSLDLLAAPAPNGSVPAAGERPLPGPLVGVRRAGGDPGREDLRAVVHEGEEVPVDDGESDEPVVGDREPGGRAGCGSHGVERERGLLVLAGDGALLRAVRDTIPATFWQ